MRILAIPGSLRRDSSNRRLLGAASELVPAGTELEVWEGLKEIPPFDEGDEDTPPKAVTAMRGSLAATPALLIATPEYNGSIPGQLKNALDWASRPPRAHVLVDKPVAVVGASPTPFGAAWAQSELRKVLAQTGADVIDEGLPVPFAYQQFDPGGRLQDQMICAGLHDLILKLCRRAAPNLEGLAA